MAGRAKIIVMFDEEWEEEEEDMGLMHRTGL